MDRLENTGSSGLEQLAGLRFLIDRIKNEDMLSIEEFYGLLGAEITSARIQWRCSIGKGKGQHLLDIFFIELIGFCAALEEIVLEKGSGGEVRSGCAAEGLGQLAGLLVEQAREYGDTFELGAKIPRSLAVFWLRPLIRDWRKAVAKLKEAGLDSAVADVLCVFASELMESESIEPRHFLYLEELMASLGKLTLVGAEKLDAELLAVMCYHNFNYLPLVRVLTMRYQRDFDKVDSYREEYISVVAQIRAFRPLPVREGARFDRGMDSLRELLCTVLEQELDCIKKMMNLNKASNGGAKSMLRLFYFRISVSMEQFLFLFRLMIDKGIVLVGRKADLYEFIHHHVGTVKKDNLSIGNMQNSFSENNRMTAIRVRAMLQSLISHIDEKYL